MAAYAYLLGAGHSSLINRDGSGHTYQRCGTIINIVGVAHTIVIKMARPDLPIKMARDDLPIKMSGWRVLILPIKMAGRLSIKLYARTRVLYIGTLL